MKRQSYAQFETAEERGSISMASLRRAAEAMDCELVYFIVPRRAGGAHIRRALARRTTLRKGISGRPITQWRSGARPPGRCPLKPASAGDPGVPITPEERSRLLPSLSTRAQLDEIERLRINAARVWAMRGAVLRRGDLLTSRLSRELHRRMFGGDLARGRTVSDDRARARVGGATG